jgi:hypothetical protein
MQELGLNLVTVLDHLRISRVVGLGDGAGANIISRSSQQTQWEYLSLLSFRFGMCHPVRVHGIVLINNTASASMGRFMDTLKVNINTLI